jgi:hypothetical protein
MVSRAFNDTRQRYRDRAEIFSEDHLAQASLHILAGKRAMVAEQARGHPWVLTRRCAARRRAANTAPTGLLPLP